MRKLGVALFALTSVSAFAATNLEHEWLIHGYLASEPAARQWVHVRGDRIASVSPSRPNVPAGTLTLETESWIFPGLIDAHNHTKYNVLPLWKQAQGQFLNRFEWRQRSPSYKDATSFNMRYVKDRALCAAVRYSEVKALVGGAVATQGVGPDAPCGEGFGVANLEVADELAPGAAPVKALLDVVKPDVMGKLYEQRIKPLMATKNISYDVAFQRVASESGATAWMKKFRQGPQDLRHAFELMLGDGLEMPVGEKSPEAFAAARARIEARLESTFAMTDATKRAKHVEAMRGWLFGIDREVGYLNVAELDADTAADYIALSAVLTVDRDVRVYIGEFEYSVRRRILKHLAANKRAVFITHLAEGERGNSYNGLEYGYLRATGLNRRGLVLIHGVGMKDADFADAAKRGVSIVWSPFSNLLLYGETLDVGRALANGVNVAIGADWTPTGSKNLLDELKLARRYLRASNINVSDRQLVEMATVSAAKVLRAESQIGKVAPGYIAHLLVVPRPTGQTDPYSTLLETPQSAIELVAVGGQPLFGRRDWVEGSAQKFGDTTRPERIVACGVDKAWRNPSESAYDRTLASTGEKPLRTLAAFRETLATARAAFVESVTERERSRVTEIDPLFGCEDESYRARVDSFIEKEWPQNRTSREATRMNEKLVPDWSPLSVNFGAQ